MKHRFYMFACAFGRELISELLPLVRFPIMTMEEILSEVSGIASLRRELKLLPLDFNSSKQSRCVCAQVQPTGLIEQDVLVDVITAQVT
jgi:hypothetical protein